MSRLAWSQLRFRPARPLALLLGILVAVTAFCLLTAASRTSQLRTIGAVAANFRPAYDILVRPARARTPLESATGTVQPDFLSGIYGGISMSQYRHIQQIPGVQVAAPIAMVGYSLPIASLTVRLPAAAAARPGRQLYRISTTWVSAAGTSRVHQPASYLYLTPDRLRLQNSTGASAETLPGGSQADVCPLPGRTSAPFGPAAQSMTLNMCWSRVNGLGGAGSYRNLTASHPGFVVEWRFPMLIAAIDPGAEARLDGLDRAVISGRYLRHNAGPGTVTPPGSGGLTLTTFPVLAAASSGIGEYSVTQVQRLASPARPPAMTLPWMARQASAPGPTVLSARVSADQAYQHLLAEMRGNPAGYPGITEYWSAGAARYHRQGGVLQPVVARNPPAVWKSTLQNGGVVAPPMDNADTQYRALTDHGPTQVSIPGNSFPVPVPRLAGVFRESRIRAFDPLSRVPLGPYQPVAAAPADAASRQALGGAGLLPSLNLGGYVSQPVQLVTTLAALPALDNSAYFSGDLHAADPISVIRVRVAGVTGPDPVSLERIKEVAQQIAVRTGLTVDIVAGSSPAPTAVSLPAGHFGRPALRLTEGWVKKGVAVTILTAVDRKSLVLFTLVLIVCALFVSNAATAAVRGRRQEIGILACLGWTRPRLFATVLGEQAMIGLVAGAAGGLVSLPLSAALGLRVSLARAALAVPVSVALALAAGAWPAWLAARVNPLSSVRPPVVPVRRGHQPGGITALALINVLRAPGRTVVGALALAVGIAALTVLTAVTIAFRGTVVGSLLGNAVAVQVRGVDYVAVAATVALGVLTVADAMFLNIRERAAELATMRALGWPEPAIARLVCTEGALIGVAGSVAGAALGLTAAAALAGGVPPRLYLAAAAAVVAGGVATAGATLLPAQLLGRMTTATLLAEE